MKRSSLADRAEPIALSSWTEITSVQYDAASLTSNVIDVEFEVGPDGTVSHVTVTKSSGNNDLDRAAVDVCKEMRWKPAVQDGEPRSFTFSHEFVVSN